MSETLINNPFIDLLGVQLEHWEGGYIRTRLDSGRIIKIVQVWSMAAS